MNRMYSDGPRSLSVAGERSCGLRRRGGSSPCRTTIGAFPVSDDALKMANKTKYRQLSTIGQSEVRMLTQSEIEALQRDKAESGRRLLAMFKAERAKAK